MPESASSRPWLAGEGRRIYLWNHFHHPTERAGIGKWHRFPCFMPDVISREVKGCHQDDVRGVLLCGIGTQPDYYLNMRTAFNVEADYQVLVTAFLSRIFGAASEPMERFCCRISKINREEGVIGTTREASWLRLGTEERMKELGGYVDEAVMLVTTDLERKRVDTWREGVWEYMKTGRDQFHAK